ncbi:MAG: FAD-dependent oxidoreductase [Proteobacteria bacterium]|nr:FAD-dependent oxidoreductase [Pseudomonadota bacterium]
MERHRMNIAVIGTGIAGMSAAWLLQKVHRITVYEAQNRIGGHSHTVDVLGSVGPTPVDTGFIVYNERNYPNLTALFSHLGVPTKDSEMSFSASLEGGGLEYSGTDLNGLVGQRLNIVRPRFWRMLRDLKRFYRDAPAFLRAEHRDEPSLAEYLARERYGRDFIEDHLLPMAAAIWSATSSEMKEYPASAFIRFFVSHGLLTLTDRPQWRTVDGGSREYVKRLVAPYADRIRLDGVRAIRRGAGGVTIEDCRGQSSRYDHAVIATHADEAFRLLADPDPHEAALLAGWRYTRNRAVLHRDPRLMPKRRRVWSSWNFIGDSSRPDDRRACVTYWMNRLQDLPADTPLFVTLNPVREPAPGTLIREFDYDHPRFDSAAVAIQKKLWSLQGNRRTWFCGSYFGYGFHEDALQSGLAVAEQLGGIRRPWSVDGESSRIHLAPENSGLAA